MRMVVNMTKVIFLLLFTIKSIENVQMSNAVQCGVSQIDKTKLILHGDETIPGAWPWHAAVYHRKRLYDIYACGGTLVTKQFVLTAAHCVVAENGYEVLDKNVFIRLGVYNLRELTPYSLQQHSVEKIHKHANYSGKDLQNDIAVLELASMAEFNNYIQPACLGLTEDLTGHYGTVVGWGRTESEELSPKLRKIRIPVIDVNTCLESDRAVFGQTLSKRILCAGYTNGTTVCNGDSGSGLFFQQNNAWYLGGIVSYSGISSLENRVCNTKGYGAFTNVQLYLPWIATITGLQFEANSRISTGQQISSQRTENIRILNQYCSPEAKAALKTFNAFKPICPPHMDATTCCNRVYNIIQQQPDGVLCQTSQGYVFTIGLCPVDFNSKSKTAQADQLAPAPNTELPAQLRESTPDGQATKDIPLDNSLTKRISISMEPVAPKLPHSMGPPLVVRQNLPYYRRRPLQQAAAYYDEDDEAAAKVLAEFSRIYDHELWPQLVQDVMSLYF